MPQVPGRVTSGTGFSVVTGNDAGDRRRPRPDPATTKAGPGDDRAR
jgi:hypothetical protein